MSSRRLRVREHVLRSHECLNPCLGCRLKLVDWSLEGSRDLFLTVLEAEVQDSRRFPQVRCLVRASWFRDRVSLCAHTVRGHSGVSCIRH